MSDSENNLAEEAKNLTFNSQYEYDDPLTLHRKDEKDPNSPWLIRVCVTQATPLINWNGAAKDFKPPSEDMLRQIHWALEKIKNHPRLKGHIEIAFTENPYNADISYMQARPIPDKGWGGKTWGGYLKGRLHKEVLLNQDDASWTYTKLHDKPDDAYNPKNPYGHAAYITEHETAHALGLNHWGYKGKGDPNSSGRNPLITADKTVLASRNNKKHLPFDYRPVDWEGFASIYVSLNAVDGNMRSASPVAVFTHDKNIAVAAGDAANHSLSNRGAGVIVVKMDPEQYKSTKIERLTDGKGRDYYMLTFDDKKKINLELDAKLASIRDGSIEALEYVRDLYANAKLAAAMKKGATPPANQHAMATPVEVMVPTSIPAERQKERKR